MKHYYLNLLLLFLPFSLFAKTNYNSIEFIENRGQWKGDFLYKAVTGGGDVYLEKNCFTYLVGAADNAEKVASYKHAKASIPPVLKYHAFKMIFDGASVPAKIEGNKAQRHYYNYFLGNDPKTWASEIHPFYNVDYAGLYKNIDLHVASENLQLKYDFIIHPEADASQIKLRFEGIDGLNIKNGKLQIKTSVGTIEELQPYAYQFADGKKISVPCEYVLEGSVVHYRFPKAYDNQQQLIIDPTVVFATFTGSTSDNWGFTATYDEQGNFYAGGAVSGVTYPTTTGAFQTTFAGGGTGGGNNGFQCDMAITKFNAAGTAIIYSTYLGGSNNDQPHSMIVDPNNNLIVAGRTYSNDFPVSATAFDNSYNGGADLVVIKLNATGTGLIGSTYIGGSGDDAVNISSIWGTVGSLKHNYGDDARSEVITDKLGNAYVALPTSSTNFPVLNAVQTVNNGQQDGAIIKLNNTLSALLWGTYIGGSGNDATYALALDTGQTSLYVAGGTASNNFPSTPGCLMPAYQGGTADGFVLKF